MNIFGKADDVLRMRPWVARGPGDWRAWGTLVGLVVLFGLFYGAVMGTYGGLGRERMTQVGYSAMKVPMLLGVTFAVSLPSFYVLNMLAGVGADFAYVVRALAATQAGLTIVLASLSPFTGVWYLSDGAYQPSILFNTAMFGVAAFSAQRLLRKYYRALIERNVVHRRLLRVWLAIYSFVGIQMGWVLRPFIGDPNQATTFFRQHAWSNAYVEVLSIVWQTIGRHGG